MWRSPKLQPGTLRRASALLLAMALGCGCTSSSSPPAGKNNPAPPIAESCAAKPYAPSAVLENMRGENVIGFPDNLRDDNLPTGVAVVQT